MIIDTPGLRRVEAGLRAEAAEARALGRCEEALKAWLASDNVATRQALVAARMAFAEAIRR